MSQISPKLTEILWGLATMLSFSKRLPFPFFSGGEGYYPWLCCTNIKDSDNSVMFQFFLGVVYFEGIILNFKAGCSWATHPQVWWALNFTLYFSCSMNLVQALLNFQPLLTSNIGRYIQQKVTPKQIHIPAFFSRSLLYNSTVTPIHLNRFDYCQIFVKIF